MADAIVSTVLEQLTSLITEEIQRQVALGVGVEKEVKKLSNNLRAIRGVLVDAEQRQVEETTVRVWLDQLKDTSYDIEDVLDEWNTAIMKLRIEGGLENALVPKPKVCFFPVHCFGVKRVVLRRDIALKIKKLNRDLEVIAKEKDMYNFNVVRSTERPERVQSISLVDLSEIYGREDEKNTLLSKLLCESSEEHKGLHIISIVGMGGIGKTVLAQLVYNSTEVKMHFQHRIWLCVSDIFDEFRIAKAIAVSLNRPATDLVELEALMQHIRASIIGKKILLILDDVWIEDYNKWEPFHHCLKNSFHGSKILVTTRKETVALMMGSTDIITIKELPKEECWLLFRHFAFFGRSREDCEKLEEMGREIVGRCKGLPLAAKSIGSLLRFKKTRDEWQKIIDSNMWKLEEFEKGIFPPLLLSYNDLPSLVKRCFLYLSIFPKDYKLKKEQLIKLWMAQGYLGLEKNDELEIVGQEYFNILATRSFFQEFQWDNEGNVIGCKMHDMVHDFALFLNKNECSEVEINGHEKRFINSSCEKIRHSMVTLNREISFPISFPGIKSLRSLLIICEDFDYSLHSDVLPMLFGELRCLRSLDISRETKLNTLIKEFPKEIGKLMYLRYLNLSRQNIEELPETLCELYNLQTLDLTWCDKLKELPQGIGKLVNLRHLINYRTKLVSHMPIGIERLTCLRTLSEFVASQGSNHGRKACTLESLKDLNSLRGYLLIRGLGNVTNVCEAERMQLKNKRNLFSLELRFNMDREGERKNEDDELLLEALLPPPNLEKLEVNFYRGNSFPSNWMMLLIKLRELSIYGCNNWKNLPPLGNLPSLESLKVYNMKIVKNVGNEFWGLESDSTSSSFFLKLKFLQFWRMEEWQEWDCWITKKGEEDIKIMPCLRSLIIGYCPILKALPNSLLQGTTLNNLEICSCPLLEKLYNKETGQDWPKISHIPNISFY